MSGATRRIGLGVAGLGRAFTLMLPTLRRDRRFTLVAAADPDQQAVERFAKDFTATMHERVEDLCRDAAVDVVYVASPHPLHAQHVGLAAGAGKHILVEKPLAISVEEGVAMVAAASAAGVHIVVGPSHSFDEPVARARAIIESGRYGRVRMIQAMNFTDFLYRPRRPEELDSGRGGGVVFSQASHQVDIVRLLGGGLVASVRALTGNWDPARPTEGAYTALLAFVDGTFTGFTYSGYGRFDSDELMGWIGELGRRKDPARYGAARRALRDTPSADAEAALKRARNYAAAGAPAATPVDAHEHFGLVVASCEHADLLPRADGVMIYADDERIFEPLPPPDIPRRAVLDELYDAAVHDRPPLHSGAWGLATLEVCIAILESARQGREVALSRQVPVIRSQPAKS